MQPENPLRYVIDRHDRIVEVGAGWNEFARENAASSLTAASILHRPLWEFINGSEPAALYRMLVRLVRESGRKVTVPFRCDAPSVLRSMQLELSPQVDGGVEFLSRPTAREPRPAVALLDASSPRSAEVLTMCGWCKKVRMAPKMWLEAAEATESLHLLRDTSLPRLSHGICEGCRGTVLHAARPKATGLPDLPGQHHDGPHPGLRPRVATGPSGPAHRSGARHRPEERREVP